MYKMNVYLQLTFDLRLFITDHISVVDSGGGTPGASPPTDQIFFNFMGFFRKCINILGWLPPLRVWGPLLGQVLDPPLHLVSPPPNASPS